jgi:hypothetical protein
VGLANKDVLLAPNFCKTYFPIDKLRPKRCGSLDSNIKNKKAEKRKIELD